MGIPWRGHPAWSVVEEVEAALGEPVGDLLLTADPDALTRTRHAQLAIFLSSLLAWRGLGPRLDDAPRAFAGHSMGERTALVAAGALTVADGARVLAARATATQAAADRQPGGMAALIGLKASQAATACDPTLGCCWVANDNAPNQVVVAGTPEGVSAATAAATLLGARRALSLNVNGAFHTPLMDAGRAAFLPTLEATPFSSPSAPVVCNTDATAHDTAAGWPTRLADHLVTTVHWRESMETLDALGVTTCIEVGPGRVLSGLAARNVPAMTVRSISIPEDLDAKVAA
jgi:[acyl-carrier-protein] S-malonyltransferase